MRTGLLFSAAVLQLLEQHVEGEDYSRPGRVSLITDSRSIGWHPSREWLTSNTTIRFSYEDP
jgi:hypothetical protein